MAKTDEKEIVIAQDNYRVDKDVKDNFAFKCKSSEIESTDGQSVRDVIAEKLLKLYVENGDKVFELI